MAVSITSKFYVSQIAAQSELRLTLRYRRQQTSCAAWSKHDEVNESCTYIPYMLRQEKTSKGIAVAHPAFHPLDESNWRFATSAPKFRLSSTSI
jgi:hypothetical protein